jgi:multiple antibiotic resistance protein
MSIPDGRGSEMNEAVNAFLLGFPALFSIVNPISGAIIFSQVTAHRAPAERTALARRVAFYSLIVMLCAFWAGSYVLEFFGITLAALRVGGGVVVALSAWNLLNAPEKRDARKQEQAAPTGDSDDVAMFPLTIPFTTGPGTISVAVALGAGHPRLFHSVAFYSLGMTVAAAALAVVIWITYRSADRLASMMGPRGSQTVTRLAAFLLLCIGVQILIVGVEDVLGPLLNGADPHGGRH